MRWPAFRRNDRVRTHCGRNIMADMKIGIIGAGGRMGQACIRQVTETGGCTVVAASDIADTPLIGSDAGKAAQLAARHDEIDLELLEALERWEVLEAKTKAEAQ